MSKSIQKGNQISASPHQQLKLVNTLNEFFKSVEPADLLEAQNQFINAFLEQEREVFNNVEGANRIFCINLQNTFMVKLYKIYRDIKEEA